MRTISIAQIQRRIPQCGRCPELRGYCAEIGREKRKSFADETYWARPVPGFGDSQAWLWIIGLAPAAHGANRTGRMFTGDRSGEFLFAGLHRAGLASQPTSTDRVDGLELSGVYISAALRCAPPANRPTSVQLATCRSYLHDEWAALHHVRVVVALGAIAWDGVWRVVHELEGGAACSSHAARPRFSHGAKATASGRHLLACYHVSQQNTFTGRLTDSMFDAILARAKKLPQVS